MKKNIIMSFAATCGLLIVSAQAQLIGVSFEGRNNGGLLAPTDTAGVIPQMNFNNITTAQYSPPDAGQGTGFTFVSPLLNSSTGAPTSVTFSIMANDSWSSGSGTSTPNHTLLNGIIKAQDGAPPDQKVVPLTINGLTPGLGYTLDIYTTENGAGAQYSITNGNTTFFQEAQDGPAYAANPVFIQGTNTVGTPGPIANYVEFTGIVPAGGSIPITFSHITGSDGAGISGFQIRQIPEPSALISIVGGLGMLLGFRRRKA